MQCLIVENLEHVLLIHSMGGEPAVRTTSGGSGGAVDPRTRVRASKSGG